MALRDAIHFSVAQALRARGRSATYLVLASVLALAASAVQASARAVQLPEFVEGDAYAIGRAHLSSYTDSACAAAMPQALQLPWAPAKGETFEVDRTGCHWLRATITTPAGHGDWTTQRWMVEVGYHGLSELGVFVDGELTAHHYMGNDRPVNDRAYPHVWSKSYRNVAPLDLRASTTYDLVVAYANPQGQSLYGTNTALELRLLPSASIDRDARLHLLFSGLMVGGLLLLCLYQAAQWTVYRDALDATYVLMLLGLMSYIMYDDFLLHALFGERRVGELWLYLTGSVGLMGFFRFAQITLRTVDYQPVRDRIIGYLVITKALEVALFSAVIGLAESGVAWVEPLAAAVPEAFRLLLIVTLLLFSYQVVMHFRENGDKGTRAFMLGNLSLVVGVLAVATRAYLLPYADVAPVRWWLALIEAPFDYIIEAGIVGMALCFAFAVALLTKEREARLERDFNRRLADVEMKALRSQMNPHFLFNGLNSIKSFVIDNRPHEAADYLSKFSKLIRNILENSKASLIPLAREIETLDLYIEMECLRFDNRFTYAIDVGAGVDAAAIEVPPTLIQPYVENAIWHGLLHRRTPGGHLHIDIDRPAPTLVTLVVEDNGVGREAATAIRSARSRKHKSLGMQITAERLAMLKQLHGFHAEVRVVDLERDGAAAGTRVEIDIHLSDGKPATDVTESAYRDPLHTRRSAATALPPIPRAPAP